MGLSSCSSTSTEYSVRTAPASAFRRFPLLGVQSALIIALSFFETPFQRVSTTYRHAVRFSFWRRFVLVNYFPSFAQRSIEPRHVRLLTRGIPVSEPRQEVLVLVAGSLGGSLPVLLSEAFAKYSSPFFFFL
ncbi:hypothetical protein SODALDRAFT_209823 [Sodiomyces alkalinus F11]|uniref:Uncharacterized protein n=1 Tax=Sodiomyces alkalinus (strain CBS 110278 / VKM F-3762 / F11) TaxID=1314773 RepID=A0A3N2PQY6_SODAK|nr:hypothetical protein SODALDRAFT_209823 [Sodiomyces alkalinus F11]ROT36895.1 hypothetical protein SODALDRAFT_209823 [Sodiomyces alkalinus F11]